MDCETAGDGGVGGRHVAGGEGVDGGGQLCDTEDGVDGGEGGEERGGAGGDGGVDDVDFCTANDGDEEGAVVHWGEVFEPCACGELVDGVEFDGEDGGVEGREGYEELHFGGMNLSVMLRKSNIDF